MPSVYTFKCTKCPWRGERYRNLKKCPDCGEPVVKVIPAVRPVKKKRPPALDGKTIRVETGCGHLYVTLGFYDEGLFEVFATLGKAGGCAMCQNEATTRSITLGLRHGVPVEDYIDELRNIQCPSVKLFPEDQKVLSCPDAIAKVLKEHGTG